MAFGALSVQFVLFTSSPETAETLFRRLAGADPVNSSQMRTPLGTTSNASGPVADVNLVLTSQSGRFDMVATPFDTRPSDSLPQPPTLPDLNKVLDTLEGYVAGIKCEVAQRLAIIVQLIEFVDSVEGMNAVLLDCFDLGSLKDDAYDVNFKMNRRTYLKTRSRSIAVNRVMSWDGYSFQQTPAPVAGGLTLIIAAQDAPQQLAAGVNIDVNTVQAPDTVFTAEEISTIFSAIRAEVVRLQSHPKPSALA